MKENKKSTWKSLVWLWVVLVICVQGIFTYKYFKLTNEKQSIDETLSQSENEKMETESADESKEDEQEKFLRENVYDNEIPIALYLEQGNGFVRADKVECDWTNEVVLGQFFAIASDEEEISSYSYKTVFSENWEKYDTNGYKIGYNLKLHFDNGETLNRTLLEPIRLSDEIFRYIQLYIYDDVAYDPSTRYYHLSPEEVTDETLLTSLKLVGSTTTPGINGPIELTVFTYNGDEDFDKETGEYLGNSKFTAKIYREKE